MTDRTELKKTMFLFDQESNILLRSNRQESPLPFKRFLDRIESEQIIAEYLRDCVTNHAPTGFDAHDCVAAVAEDMNATFVNFSTDPKEESAEVYMILKEVIEQGIRGRSDFYYGFGDQNKKYEEMYKGFLDKVVRRLITNINCNLSIIGIEMGLDDKPSGNNYFYGDLNGSQVNQATGNARIDANQSNSFGDININKILDSLASAAEAEIEDEETLNDVRDNVEIVRAQVASGKPKRGVLKSAIGFLRGISGGAQFAAAIADLISFATTVGINF